MVDLLQNVRLASPGWLTALLLVPLVVVAVRGSLTRESTVRRIIALGLRAVVLSLLVLALCAPVVDSPNHSPWVVLLVDQSESLAAEAAERARQFAEDVFRQASPDRVLVLPFAAEAGEPMEGVLPGSPQVDSSATDLAAAFEAVAAVSRPSGPERIVLLSDGNATVRGNVLSAAGVLQVPVDTVPLPARPGPDVWLERVESPSEVRPDELVHVQVVVRSDRDARVIVRVASHDKELESKEVDVSGGRLVVPFSVPLASGPRDLFRINVEAAPDSQAANNAAEVAVWHKSPARALLIGRETGRFSRLSEVLRRERLEVETGIVDRLPADLARLSQFALVILADVPASDLSPQQIDTIEQYVRDDAGGLIVFGGPDSLTAGGYGGTALERTLPVTCEYDIQTRRASLAMVLAIDQSGSMAEGNAIGLAKKAVQQTVAMLDARDQLGVIAFEDTTQWIAPLQPCDNKPKVLREIESLTAAGGTNMHPAIAKAHLALNEAFADLKHIIVLTDGISYPGDFDTLASEVSASGITISTVAVGSEVAEPLLQAIAQRSGGNYHHCRSAAELPEIFVRETAKAARMGIREQPFFPQAEALLATIAPGIADKPPTLLGYVQTRAKPDAQVGMVSETGDPLVAWWRYGQGRAAVFTSDLRGAWSRPWQSWTGLERLWAALVEQTLRPTSPDGYRLVAARQGNSTVVTLDAVPEADRFENRGKVSLDAMPPSGLKQKLVMPLVAPGQYAVRVATPDAGACDFLATCEVAGRPVFTGRCSVCPGYAAETIPGETNETLLRELAAATGGRFNPPSGELLQADGPPSLRTHTLWHYLLLAAMLVYLGELAVRRLARNA